MDGRTVVIRTLDIGADKQADYFQLPQEENPAMGMRAIRICLTRPEVFRTQLRALYRASAHGRLALPRTDTGRDRLLVSHGGRTRETRGIFTTATNTRRSSKPD